jgi:PAS domain S-box-containing protein
MPDSMFSTFDEKSVNIGYSDSSFWFKINVVNRTSQTQSWLFESQYPIIDYLSIYNPSGYGYKVIHSGDRFPFINMPFEHFNFISQIISEPGLSTIFLRLKSEGSIIAKFRAWDNRSYGRSIFKTISTLWLFYGIMIALLFYSLIIFISTRDKVYIALASMIFSCLMFTFIHNGLAKKYLWPDMQWWGNFSHPFFIFMGIISMLWFTILFFNTKLNLKTSHRILKILLLIAVPLSFIILTLPYSISTRISVIFTSIISGFIIIFVLFPMFFIRRRLALYFLGSWFFFAMGDILLSLRSFGFINESFIAAWSFQISLTTGLFFLSVGVADKLNSLRRDNEMVLSTLKESEERYRLFFETAHDAIVYYIDVTPAYANKNMIKISGYSEEEFYTTKLFDLFPDNKIAETDLQRTINELSSGSINHARFEHILMNKNSERLSVLVSLSPVSAGIHKGILMIISDISSMKRAALKIQEQYSEIQAQLKKVETLNNELIFARNNLVDANSELEKEKEYLSATLSSIGDGVISYDTNGKIFLINRVAEELTGIKAADALGKNIREILKLSDETSKELLFETLGTVSDKYNFSNIGVPFKLYDSEKNERIVELNSSVIKLHENPIGIVLALRDITIKSRIDNELIKMSKLESIGILAGGIAHDFNNLLTGISANVSLLNNTCNIPLEVSDSLSDISKAVERATALTKQLLTFAKGGTPVMKAYPIDELVKESIKFIVKDIAIKTETSIEDNLPAALIDPNQISQPINNLLINAIQAMPEGGTLSIVVKKTFNLPPDIPLKTGSFILIKISDTGCGIPRKNLNKIFDPFFTTKSNGTGFGLTSTYSIIKKHRGYIRVDSSENKGTTFEIYIRTSGEKPDETEIDVKSIKSISGGSVLIMDDEEYILEVLVKMLKYHGFAVSTAKTGEEAVALYKENLESGSPFDYVILDLTVFNGMGGKETVAILRDIDPNVKAIVSSGYSDNPVLSNYKDYGFSGILSKPYVIEDVLKAIHEL